MACSPEFDCVFDGPLTAERVVRFLNTALQHAEETFPENVSGWRLQVGEQTDPQTGTVHLVFSHKGVNSHSLAEDAHQSPLRLPSTPTPFFSLDFPQGSRQ